jgi:hypothetical protein
MTPRERLLAALKGRPVDRVPLVMPGFTFVSREAIDAHPDPRRREVAHRIHDWVAYDLQVPSYINRYLVTPPQRIRQEVVALANGCQEIRGTLDTPKGTLTFVTQFDPVSDTTWTVEYPVKTLHDLETIASVPWELPDGLAPPAEIEAEGFDTRGYGETRISSPFVCVAGMMKFEQFLEFTATEPTLIDELTDVCLERTLDVLEVLLSKPGIEVVWIGGSEWVTPPMASPRVYDRLVQEQERRLIDYVHAQGDIAVHVHCHGHVRHALQRMIERGTDYTEPVEPPPDGDITMAEAKQLAAGRITLGGNVECRVLCNGLGDEVEVAVRAAFEGGKERFILRPTEGPSPTMDEREFRNWMTMVNLWETLSPVP